MKDKITFSDLIDKIANETGETKTLIHELLTEIVALNRESLEKEGQNNISGLGRFSLKWHKARRGRHPQSGEMIDIPEHNTLAFNANSSLRDHINRKYVHFQPELIETKKPLIEKEVAPVIAAKEETPVSASPQKPILEKKIIEDSKRIVSAKKEVPFSSKKPKNPKKKWIWLLLPLILIILFFLFWWLLDSYQKSDYQSNKVKNNNTSTEKTIKPVQENKDQTLNNNKPADKPKIVSSGIPETKYTVQPDDYFYNIARVHYKKESLWPLIYVANRDLMQNPDLLAPPGKILILPGLEGTPENLSMQDKKNLAKAYIEVYFFYQDINSQKAVYHLWVAKKLNKDILENYSNQIYFRDIEAANNFKEKL